MHRIDSPGATPGNLFTEGDPGVPTPPTEVSADWLNDTCQEELCNTVEDAGLTLDKAKNDQLLDAIQIIAGRKFGFRNAVINGGMDFWQRGVTFSAAGYAADRWVLEDVSGTFTCTRAAMPAADVGHFSYFLRYDQTVNATQQPKITQRIEDVRVHGGRTVVFSAWMKADSSHTVNVEVVQNFGSGGSGQVVTALGNPPVTAGWNRFSGSVAIPSVAGKTIGVGSYTALRFKLPASGTYTIDLVGVQMELGNVETEYEVMPMETALSLCQRYYQKSYDVDTDAGTVTAVGQIAGHEPGSVELHGCLASFGSWMREAPTIVWYSPDSGASGKVYAQGADDVVASTSGTGQRSTGSPTITGPVTDPAYEAHYTADAEL